MLHVKEKQLPYLVNYENTIFDKENNMKSGT